MRSVVMAAILAVTAPTAAFAQAAPAAADAVTPAAKAAAAAMTTSTTTIGDMLDNAAAKAVLQKHLPDVVSSDQIDMARSMTLKDIQSYAEDSVTDAKLAAVDSDLAALKK